MLSLKSYLNFVSIIFFVVGFLHLFRLVSGIDIVIGRFTIPQWASVVGVCVSWYLSYCAFVLSKKKK